MIMNENKEKYSIPLDFKNAQKPVLGERYALVNYKSEGVIKYDALTQT